MLAEAIVTIITGNAGLTALLGTSSSRADSTNGVFPSQAIDEPAVPYIVYDEVSETPESVTFEGTGPLHTARYRFSCYGSASKQAKQLALKLKKVLVDKSVLGRYASAAVQINHTECSLVASTSESIGHGTLFGSHIDIEFVFDDLEA